MDFSKLEINYIDGNKILAINLNDQGFANENILANFKNPILEFHYRAKNNKNKFSRFFYQSLRVVLKLSTIQLQIIFFL